MHVPVLLHEVIGGLSLHEGDTVVDATVGGAGYTRAMCQTVGKRGTVVGFDLDSHALSLAAQTLSGVPCALHLVRANFRTLDAELARLGIAEIDGIAFDLGWSSVQLEESGRGFSFLKDEPLTMTLTDDFAHVPFTARDILNDWKEEDIANVVFGYGEERYARRIAHAVVASRAAHPIETTFQLVEIVKGAVPGRYRNGPIHPATRTFQALRIAVNDELAALTEGLGKAYALLSPGKRMAVVSFHSLDDRIVKTFFKEKTGGGSVSVTKKPIVPSPEEIARNLRSRSAKLRILQK
jgi:16S rRNA (cytosine1402-N4)-methyltransferase